MISWMFAGFTGCIVSLLINHAFAEYRWWKHWRRIGEHVRAGVSPDQLTRHAIVMLDFACEQKGWTWEVQIDKKIRNYESFLAAPCGYLPAGGWPNKWARDGHRDACGKCGEIEAARQP